MAGVFDDVFDVFSIRCAINVFTSSHPFVWACSTNTPISPTKPIRGPASAARTRRTCNSSHITVNAKHYMNTTVVTYKTEEFCIEESVVF
jgi:hypothetical protein